MRTLLACVAALSLASAQVAIAQDSEAPQLHADDIAHGARVQQIADGFSVVTHGIWSVPSVSGTPGASEASRQTSRTMRPLAQNRRDRAAVVRRVALLDRVRAAEEQFGIPEGLLDALIWTESRYNPLAVSPAGAVGLGQLMPGTARQFGVTNRMDPVTNLWGSAQYLRQLLDRFGLVYLALAAYNSGPAAVDRAGGIPLNRETPGYVRRVLEFWGAR